MTHRATRREALSLLASAAALAAAGPATAEVPRVASPPATANGFGVHFGFTKLVVGDLEKSAAFYRAVCGVSETSRMEASIAGRKISEILFAPTATGGATLVLLAFQDAPKPAAGEVILGVVTTDLDAFFARAAAAGGAVLEVPHELPELKIRVGFVSDVEGHMIEVVQPLA